MKGASVPISEAGRVSMPSVFCFGRSGDSGCAKPFFPPFEQAAVWLLQLKSGFLIVSALVRGTLDWALSADEHGGRLFIKAVGQEKRQCDSRMAEGRGIGDCSLPGWIGNVSCVLLKMLL